MSRDPTAFRAARSRPQRPLSERLAKVYDEEIHPLWGARFEALLREQLPETLTGAVLEIGCATGTLTAELLRRHDGSGRIVAVDPSGERLDRTRERLGDAMGGRVFLRTLDPGNKLPFAEETFDRVLAHAVLGEMPHPAARADHVADLARVTAPGGTVAATFALRGSFGEVLDLFDEALVRLGRPDRREALDAHRAAQPDGPTLVRECEHAGLEAVQVAVSRWEVLFRSGRELFYAPVIEQGPLPAWKALAAGDGGAPRERNAAMQAVFLAVKEAVDTYAGGHGFAVSVVAARVSGYRRGEDTAP